MNLYFKYKKILQIIILSLLIIGGSYCVYKRYQQNYIKRNISKFIQELDCLKLNEKIEIDEKIKCECLLNSQTYFNNQFENEFIYVLSGQVYNTICGKKTVKFILKKSEKMSDWSIVKIK